MGINDYIYEEFKGWCSNCINKESKVCKYCEQKVPTHFRGIEE